MCMLMEQVMKHLLHLMRVEDKVVQRRVALALAHLCAPEERKNIFLDNHGKIVVCQSLIMPVTFFVC